MGGELYRDQGGSLYEEPETLAGAEMQDTEEEGSQPNLSQERRKYVMFIELIVCSFHSFCECYMVLILHT